MIPRKGLDILLRACEQLRDMSWQLTLVGDGPLHRKLEREFAHSFPRERVIFRGEVPYEKRHEAFAGHHVFVFPSRWDGWGMVVPEALAAGLPVVATDQIIAAHEFIQDGINGFVIPVNDPGALAEKMAYFIRFPGNIHQMALAGREGIKEFRPEVGAEKLMNFLTHLTAKNNESCRKTLTQKMGQNPLTWKNLTTPDSIPKYAWKEIRHGSKKSVIMLGNVLRRNARPKGHRILVYHLVLKEDRNSFEEQMKFLTDHFLVGSLSQIIEAMGEGEGASPFRVAITFDDGFRVLLGDCLEILEKHKLRASFFIPTGFVELADRPEMAARFSLKAHYYNFALEPMRPEDLQTLVKLGHEIGSHGVSHIGIGSMSRQQATRELVWSGQRLRQWTGISPAGFAYPYGHTFHVSGDPAEWIRRAGYSFGVTMNRGVISSGSNPLRLPREHAEGNWSVRELSFFLLS
jgi:peptidoglycan/xylan/chitin deacetylase (PgdA/CDA1 family)